MSWLATEVRVPGKVMLAGEYSVLYGGRALAVAVDAYMHVTATLVPGQVGLIVHSDIWPSPRWVKPGARELGASFEPLLRAAQEGLEAYQPQGTEIRVTSGFRTQDGLGSSSAVSLGTLLALQSLARASQPEGPARDFWDAARRAYLLQRQAQGSASGYDVATQLLGGFTCFRAFHRENLGLPWPAMAERLEFARLAPYLQVYVGGRGAPTASTLAATDAWLAGENQQRALSELSERLIDAFLAVATSGPLHLAALLRLVKAHRSLLEAGPKFPRAMASELAALPGDGETWSFKTTGAGGEDALLLIGEGAYLAPATRVLKRRGWQQLPNALGTDGASVRRVLATASSPMEVERLVHA